MNSKFHKLSSNNIKWETEKRIRIWNWSGWKWKQLWKRKKVFPQLLNQLWKRKYLPSKLPKRQQNDSSCTTYSGLIQCHFLKSIRVWSPTKNQTVFSKNFEVVWIHYIQCYMTVTVTKNFTVLLPVKVFAMLRAEREFVHQIMLCLFLTYYTYHRPCFLM